MNTTRGELFLALKAPSSNPLGERLIWLPRDVLDSLNHLRRPESYSDWQRRAETNHCRAQAPSQGPFGRSETRAAAEVTALAPPPG
jgi:hypothetical protein